jgi:hypothetical protein
MAFNLLNMLGIGGQAQPNMLSAAAQPQAAPQAPSLLDRYQNFTQSDRGRALNDFFTGLAMGQNPQQSLGYGAKLVSAGAADRRSKQQSTEQRNQTVEWLKGRGLSDQDAALLAGNTPALSEYLKNTLAPDAQKPTSDIQNYQFAVQQGYKGNFAQWQKDKGSGVTVNLPGQPNIGTIPPGYAAQQDPVTHSWSMQPIPGGPAAEKADAAANAANIAKTTQDRNANVVVQDIDRALGRIKESPGTTTGVVGGLLSHVPGTSAYNTGKLLDTVKANSGFDRLQAMRDASPTGGALGQVSKSEMDLLQAAIGNLEQSQETGQFTDNIKRVKNIYLDIIYGPGNGPEREKLSFDQQQGNTPDPLGIR